MADSKKYDGSQWEHSLRKLTTATEAVENPLYSDGTAITSYTIKGNTVQSGTPTPSSPITISGVGNKTANLLPPPVSSKNETINDVTFNLDKNGVCTINGTASANTTFTYDLSEEYTVPISIANGGTGAIYLWNSQNAPTVSINVYYNSTLIDNWYCTPVNRVSSSYAAMANKTINKLSIYIPQGVSYNGTISFMISETGQIETTYEPYGYKIPISNDQQTIDIYIGDLPLLKSLDGTAVDEISNGILTRRVDSDGSVLPTPTTTQITMPSIPTTEGANSITVDTTVQPSEFTATWTGWHDSSVKEWDGSQWNE